MIRTMGVDQVAGGLEVSVAEWTDAGARTPLFDGLIGGGWSEVVRTALTIAEFYEVKRALVDPHPDVRWAQRLSSVNPQVFALHAGSQHNAASLAEVAWRRAMAVDVSRLPGETVGTTQVVGIEPDVLDPGNVAVRVYVHPGDPTPTHVSVELAGGDEMVRADGSKIIERVVPVGSLGLTMPSTLSASAPLLAPTTKLPYQGWTAVLSIYANSVLIHEHVVSERQLLGLKNLLPEMAALSADWIGRTALDKQPPFRAEFTIYAGQTQIHQDVAAGASAMETAAALLTTANTAASWIAGNAVAMEQLYPGVNLPYEQYPTTEEIAADTFDVPGR